jgi:hypothetical protein
MYKKATNGVKAFTNNIVQKAKEHDWYQHLNQILEEQSSPSELQTSVQRLAE